MFPNFISNKTSFKYQVIAIALWLISFASLAQSPNAIPYQGVARNASATILSTQAISLRISLRNLTAGGTIVYQETHNTTTTSLGLFNLNIGSGTPVVGTLAAVNWAGGAKFIQVELDPAGGTSYTDMGTTQLMSVPYALHAKTADVPGLPGPTGPQGPAGPAGVAPAATYRWATFHTYDQSNGFQFSNDASLFGGVLPSDWTDNNALAFQISSNKAVQRTLFQQKGYAKENAMVYSNQFIQYSSTDGEMVAVLFRISNTTGSAIVWTPNFYYTAYDPWGEKASITVNGANTWSSGNTSFATTVPLTIPSGQVSTVIFVSASGNPFFVASNLYSRSCRLAFINNCLTLPAGLSFVDDLDTATGGWGQ